MWRLLEKLADDKPVNVGKSGEEPEVTILRRVEAVGIATLQEDAVLMEKKSCGHWLTKFLITYLSGFRVGRRKWHLRKKLNTWD